MACQGKSPSNTDPLVSVILPAYNAERYIGDAVDSLIRQTHTRLEIVIVNDGSQDCTRSILDAYAAADDRINVIHTENHGLVAALNLAIEKASGPFIARMDADDICEPTRIEQQVAYLTEHPECVALGTNVVRIDQDGTPLQKQSPDRASVDLPDRCQHFKRFPPAPAMLVHPSAMIRAEPLRRVGGYRPSFQKGAEDRDLWWRLSARGEIKSLPERLLRYRIHETNRSHTLREGAIADALISDVSAICRFHELDDTDLLTAYGRNRNLPSIIEQYSDLLGERYPVWALHAYRVFRRGAKGLIGETSMANFKSQALRKALASLNARPSWYVLSAIAQKPFGR